MQLLKIDGIDFTKYINDSTYNVSSQSVYEEWTDANYKNHRAETRKRIEGSFDMVFVTSSEYDAFINKLGNSNLVTMEVYVGGMINKLVTSKFYYKIKTQSHREISNTHIFNKINVTLEEQ